MKYLKLTILTLVVAISAGCKKDYDKSQYDRLDLLIQTDYSGTADTTIITIKSRLPINEANYTDELVYMAESDRQVTVKIPTTKNTKEFYFDWLINDGKTAKFKLYKSEKVGDAKWGF